ncbi:MAG: sodium:solute symporter family protein, partial [Myxococcota bacterium]
MNMSQIDLGIIAAYLVITLVVGLYYGRKTDSFKDFAVGDRNLGTFALFATMFATVVGGASTIGISEKVFNVGLVFVFVCAGSSIHKLIEGFLVFGKMENCIKKSISAGDIASYFYGRTGKLLIGITTVMLFIGYVGIQVRAIGYLFEHFLGTTFTQGALLGAGLVAIYASFGGMRAVTATDVLQFAVLAIAIPLLAYWGLKQIGGYQPIIKTVPA